MIDILNLDKIIETVAGYPVKNLIWKPNMNVITGLVADPNRVGNTRSDLFIGCAWDRYGAPMLFKKLRKDLYLKIWKP